MSKKPEQSKKSRPAAKIETMEPLVLMSASAIDGEADIFAAEAGGESDLVLELQGEGTLYGSCNALDLGLTGWQLTFELQETDVNVNFYEDGSFDLNASDSAESFTVKVTDENGQSVNCTILVNGEAGSGETGSGETGSGETGSGETGSGETGSGETGSGETGSGETGSGETGSGETGSGETGSGETGSGETGSGETGSDGPTLSLEGPQGSYLGGNVNSLDLGLRGWQLKYELIDTDVAVNFYSDGSFDLNAPDTAESFEVKVTDEYGESVIVTVDINGGSDSGSGETGSGETGSGETGSGETGSGETGSGETGSGETGSGETGSGETGSGETGSGETGSGETGDGPTLSLDGPEGSYLGGNVNALDLGLQGWKLKYELLETNVSVNFYSDGSFDLNAPGTAQSFDVKVTDEYGESVIVTVNVNSDLGSGSGGSGGGSGENTAPVGVKDTYYADFGSSVWGNVLDNDSDADGDTLTATLKTQPQHGSVVLNSDGSFDYIPDDGFSGKEVFEYVVSDGNGGSSVSEVCIFISADAGNGAPNAVNDTISTPQSRPIQISVLSNDTDPQNDTLSVTSVEAPANGSAVVNSDGTVTYTPNDSFVGTETFSYTVSDGNGGYDTASISVTVDADFDRDGKIDDVDTDDDNDGLSDDREINELGTNPFDHDTDDDGIQDGTEVGETVGTPDSTGGAVSFVPDADPSSTTNPLDDDTDNDGLLDGEEDSNHDGATTNVIGDTGTTGSGETDPNNADTDGDGLTDGNEVDNVGSNPLDTDTDDGGVDDGDEVANGTDPVSTPGDDYGTSTNPNAVNDTISTPQSRPVQINVLSNDTDPQNDSLSVVSLQTPANGTAYVDSNGVVTYTPNDSFVGTETFSYTVSDGNGGTDTATITVTVDADYDRDGKIDDVDTDDDNDGLSDEREINELGTNPLDEDTDGDGIQDGTEVGETVGTPDSTGGAVSFVPDADPSSTTNPLDDDSDNDGLLDGEEDTNHDGATTNVIGDTGTTGSGETDPNNADTDGDGLSDGNEVDNVGTNPLDTDTDDGGVDDGDEVADGTEPVNTPGDDMLPNDAPEANNDSANGAYGQSINIDVLNNDTDADGDTLMVTATTDGSHGVVVVNNNGTVTYTPDTGFSGSDSFSYTISDGNGGIDSATVSVDVADRNPVTVSIVGDSVINEGSTKSFRVRTSEAVLEDTYVTINVQDMGANFKSGNTSNIDRQDIMWGGRYSVGFGNGHILYYVDNRVPNGTSLSSGDRAMIGPSNATWDYSTYKNGVADDGTITLKISAGQTMSDTFEVTAWQEKITTDGFIHSSNAGVEYNEAFKLRVSSVSGDDAVVANGVQKQVQIQDRTNVYRVSPIGLDLNGDGKIGVTGATSSEFKDADAELGRTVEFDIDADGDLDTIEWFAGDGDGILVDTTQISEDGSIDGSALFGDQGGQFNDGYAKLSQHDDNGDGQVSGDEMLDLAVWVDDGDAILEEGELQTLQQHKIASLNTGYNRDAEGRMQSSAVLTDGNSMLTEDVWFAAK